MIHEFMAFSLDIMCLLRNTLALIVSAVIAWYCPEHWPYCWIIYESLPITRYISADTPPKDAERKHRLSKQEHLRTVRNPFLLSFYLNDFTLAFLLFQFRKSRLKFIFINLRCYFSLQVDQQANYNKITQTFGKKKQ